MFLMFHISTNEHTGASVPPVATKYRFFQRLVILDPSRPKPTQMTSKHPYFNMQKNGKIEFWPICLLFLFIYLFFICKMNLFVIGVSTYRSMPLLQIAY